MTNMRYVDTPPAPRTEYAICIVPEAKSRMFAMHGTFVEINLQQEFFTSCGGLLGAGLPRLKSRNDYYGRIVIMRQLPTHGG